MTRNARAGAHRRLAYARPVTIMTLRQIYTTDTSASMPLSQGSLLSEAAAQQGGVDPPQDVAAINAGFDWYNCIARTPTGFGSYLTDAVYGKGVSAMP